MSTGSFLARPQPPKAAPATPSGPAASPFRQRIAARPNTPAKVVALAPSLWAQTWPDRQTEDAQVGLRLYSETDAQQARAAAAQKAFRLHPQEDDEDARIEAYNGALMVLLVARSTCDPEDVSIPFFGSHDGAVADILPLALTPKGIEYLFEELEILTSEQATNPEASDEELAWLADQIRSGEVWGKLPADTARRIKRLLGRSIDDMRGFSD